MLNPLYLVGDFAVLLDPIAIAERAPTGEFEAYEANGLPFYAGVVEYRAGFDLDAVPAGDRALVALEFEDTFLEACEVSINSGAWQPLLWSPYTCAMPTDCLQVGANEVRIRVYTSLIRSFEGQRFNHIAHRQEDIA